MNVSKQNPFPGINPWMQKRWPDVHTALITYIRDALAVALPEDLSASAEEALYVVGGEQDGQRYLADVGVRQAQSESWITPWQPSEQDGGIMVAEPIVVDDEAPTARWVNISDRQGRLITVIEVLSPSNKSSSLANYQQKILHLRNAGVNVVELDFIRGGTHAVAIPVHDLPYKREENSIICVSRDAAPGRRQYQIYPTPLTQPLPGIRIPLRHGERDTALALQPLIDRCYAMGRYWQMDYKQPPEPPLSPELAAWASEKLSAAGF